MVTTMINIYKYITKNRLDELFDAYCHLPEGTRYGGVNQYTPTFRKVFGRTHECPNCKYGVMLLKDQNRAVWHCYKCGYSKNNIFRFNGAGKHTGRLDLTQKRVRYHCYTGRAFYSTLGVFDKERVKQYDTHNDSGSWHYNWSLMNAFNLAIDIDIKGHAMGNITDKDNSAALQKVIDRFKEKLSCCENNINLQTSGNGAYVILHHSMCTDDIAQTAAKYRLFVQLVADEMENDKILGRVKIDTHLINLSSQIFKLPGSIHQEHDLVAMPLSYDSDLTKINWFESAHPSSFNINDYISDDTVSFYNRKDTREKSDFLRMLDETFDDADATFDKSMASDKLTYKNTDGNESSFFTTHLSKDKSYKDISMSTMYNITGEFTTNVTDPIEFAKMKRFVDRVRSK